MTDPNSNDEDDLFKGGPSLSADGRLERRFDKVEDPVPLPLAPSPTGEQPIELAERAPKKIEPRIEVFREMGPSKADRRRRAAIIAVVVLLLVGVGGFAAFAIFRPRLGDLPDGVTESSLFRQLNSGEPVPVIITSTPSGAKLTIGTTEVGVTPWAGENVWQGKTRVRLQAPGYKTWEGQLEPHKPVTLDIELKK